MIFVFYCFTFVKVKPVGKLVISEKFQIEEGCEKGGASEKKSNTTKQSSIASSSGSSCCSSDAESNDIADDDDKCNSSDQEVKPIAGKKIQKKLNDQCFTIETTVTVEKCADRKKGKKKGMTNEANRLSESSPQKKKKMSSQRGTELGCWAGKIMNKKFTQNIFFSMWLNVELMQRISNISVKI